MKPGAANNEKRVRFIENTLKAEIDRAHPELKGMGNSQATMDFMIECAQDAWETLAPELLNKLSVDDRESEMDAMPSRNSLSPRDQYQAKCHHFSVGFRSNLYGANT